MKMNNKLKITNYSRLVKEIAEISSEESIIDMITELLSFLNAETGFANAVMTEKNTVEGGLNELFLNGGFKHPIEFRGIEIGIRIMPTFDMRHKDRLIVADIFYNPDKSLDEILIPFRESGR